MTAEICMLICYISAGLCVLFLIIAAFIFFKFDIIGVVGDLSGSTAKKAIKNIKMQNSSDQGTYSKKKYSASQENVPNKITNADYSGMSQNKSEKIEKNIKSKNAEPLKDISDRKKTKPANVADKREKAESKIVISEDANKSESLRDMDIPATDAEEASETTVLGISANDDEEASETTVLEMPEDDGETSVLGVYEDESDSQTTVLVNSEENDDCGETTVLENGNSDEDDFSETVILPKAEASTEYDDDYSETSLLGMNSIVSENVIKILDEITFVFSDEKTE